MGLRLRRCYKTDIHRARDQGIGRRSQAGKRHVHHVDISRDVDQRDTQMRRAADAGAAEIELARIGLRMGHQFRHRLQRHLGVDRYRERQLQDAGNESEIIRNLIRERGLHGRQDRQAVGHGPKQRVAVGGRFRDQIGAHLACGAGLVLNIELLIEPLAQLLGDDAPHEIGAAACRKRDHHADRSRRIVLGRRRQHARDKPDGRKRGQNALSLQDPLPRPVIVIGAAPNGLQSRIVCFWIQASTRARRRARAGLKRGSTRRPGTRP